MIFPDSLLTPSEFKFGATSRESRIGFFCEEHRLLKAPAFWFRDASRMIADARSSSGSRTSLLGLRTE